MHGENKTIFKNGNPITTNGIDTDSRLITDYGIKDILKASAWIRDNVYVYDVIDKENSSYQYADAVRLYGKVPLTENAMKHAMLHLGFKVVDKDEYHWRFFAKMKEDYDKLNKGIKPIKVQSVFKAFVESDKCEKEIKDIYGKYKRLIAKDDFPIFTFKHVMLTYFDNIQNELNEYYKKEEKKAKTKIADLQSQIKKYNKEIEEYKETRNKNSEKIANFNRDHKDLMDSLTKRVKELAKTLKLNESFILDEYNKGNQKELNDIYVKDKAIIKNRDSLADKNSNLSDLIRKDQEMIELDQGNIETWTKTMERAIKNIEGVNNGRKNIESAFNKSWDTFINTREGKAYGK